MLVYGDVERTVDAEELKRALRCRLAALEEPPPDLSRHADLVATFIAASGLVQAAIDAEFGHTQYDDVTVTGRDGMLILERLATAVVSSWTRPQAPLPDLLATLPLIDRLDLPGALQIKPAEGYAYYALYPEGYAVAAMRSGLPASTRVIGIRSIGTGLAAIVAAALGAGTAVTLRPVGHPFQRRIAMSDRLADHALSGDPPAFAIVDEGPGLSGSSFGTVADWLEDHGVPRERIHFFPSHGGDPGEQASSAHRSRWPTAPRHHVSFEDLLLHGDQAPLKGWVEDLLGPLDAPLHDISGGAWRQVVGIGESVPVAPQWERRKYLATRGKDRWLVKFGGLGDEGERKLELARQLHALGFGPEPAGLCHGFLVLRWVDSPNLTQAGFDRHVLVRQLASYLAFRATLAVPQDGGADLPHLIEMAIHNTREALGDDAASAIARRLAGAEALQPRVRPVEIDGRLHPWEWLVSGNRLLKTDSLDHSRAHDFIGAQDIAWDVAGAVIEHDLTAAEAQTLVATLAAAGTTVDPQLLDAMTICYLAFQLGAWTMSTGPTASITQRYAILLRALSEGPRLSQIAEDRPLPQPLPSN